MRASPLLASTMHAVGLAFLDTPLSQRSHGPPPPCRAGRQLTAMMSAESTMLYAGVSLSYIERHLARAYSQKKDGLADEPAACPHGRCHVSFPRRRSQPVADAREKCRQRRTVHFQKNIGAPARDTMPKSFIEALIGRLAAMHFMLLPEIEGAIRSASLLYFSPACRALDMLRFALTLPHFDMISAGASASHHAIDAVQGSHNSHAATIVIRRMHLSYFARR